MYVFAVPLKSWRLSCLHARLVLMILKHLVRGGTDLDSLNNLLCCVEVVMALVKGNSRLWSITHLFGTPSLKLQLLCDTEYFSVI